MSATTIVLTAAQVAAVSLSQTTVTLTAEQLSQIIAAQAPPAITPPPGVGNAIPAGVPSMSLKGLLDGGPSRYLNIPQRRVAFKFSGGANFCQMSTSPGGYAVNGTYWNLADGPYPSDVAHLKQYGAGGIHFAPGSTLVVDVPTMKPNRLGVANTVDLVVQRLG